MRRFGVRIPTVSRRSNQIPDESWGFLVLGISHSQSVSPTHSAIYTMDLDERKGKIEYSVKQGYQCYKENFLAAPFFPEDGMRTF